MSKDKPQPYTLGWWLLMHRHAAHTAERIFQHELDEEGDECDDRFDNLAAWIERRIVRKYGVIDTLPAHTLRQLRNRPAPSEPGSWRRAAGVLEGAIERGPDGQWRATK